MNSALSPRVLPINPTTAGISVGRKISLFWFLEIILPTSVKRLVALLLPLVPLKGSAPTNFNFVTDDYDRITGLKGDGSTKWLNPHIAESNDFLNNRSISTYVHPGDNTAKLTCLIGNGAGGGDNATSIFTEPDGLVSRSQNSAAFRPSGVPAVVGLIGNTRGGSAEFTTRYNGISTDTSRATTTLTGNLNFGVFARSGGDSRTAERLRFYHIGTDINLSALDARVSALMDTIEDALT